MPQAAGKKDNLPDIALGLRVWLLGWWLPPSSTSFLLCSRSTLHYVLTEHVFRVPWFVYNLHEFLRLRDSLGRICRPQQEQMFARCWGRLGDTRWSVRNFEYKTCRNGIFCNPRNLHNVCDLKLLYLILLHYQTRAHVEKAYERKLLAFEESCFPGLCFGLTIFYVFKFPASGLQREGFLPKFQNSQSSAKTAETAWNCHHSFLQV